MSCEPTTYIVHFAKYLAPSTQETTTMAKMWSFGSTHIHWGGTHHWGAISTDKRWAPYIRCPITGIKCWGMFRMSHTESTTQYGCHVYITLTWLPWREWCPWKRINCKTSVYLQCTWPEPLSGVMCHIFLAVLRSWHIVNFSEQGLNCTAFSIH